MTGEIEILEVENYEPNFWVILKSQKLIVYINILNEFCHAKNHKLVLEIL